MLWTFRITQGGYTFIREFEAQESEGGAVEQQLRKLYPDAVISCLTSARQVSYSDISRRDFKTLIVVDNPNSPRSKNQN